MSIKKIIPILFVFLFLFSFTNVAQADPSDVNLVIRDGGNVIFSGAVALPLPGTVSINDSDGNPHNINALSVLNMLNVADSNDPSWSVSNLTYYSSFGSLYLKCVNYSSGDKCDNWQYVINDASPASSIDQNILSGGETVYFYFGNNHRVRLLNGQVDLNKSFNVTTERYNYINNTWGVLTGVTIGATQPNPNDTWNPIEVVTKAVDGNGVATISLSTEGSYNIGIKEDYYYPTESLIVVKPLPPSGGVTEIAIKKEFDLDKAYNFIVSQQKDDGSFGADIYTDWAGIALSSTSNFSSVKDKLKIYLLSQKVSDYGLTDYERRSMVLMSLGINPYDVNKEDYIKKITDAFDGEQFGDKTLVNDDVFALIVLQNAGYTKNDEIVNKDISFILSKQNSNGSWEESVDMTGATIEGLSIFQDVDKVKDALSKAKNYLKQNQKNNGGWSNISSTSWALEGALSLGENIKDWSFGDKTPSDYFGVNQDVDGGTINKDLNSKTWETAYAILALSGKTWNSIMNKFDKKILVSEVEKEVIPVVEVKKEDKNPTPPVKVLKSKNVVNVLAKQNTASAVDAPIKTENKTTSKNWVSRFFSWLFNY